ncbi:MAG: hypothetical protein IT561_04565 [Alphaproteobacteria bacterium]|nr:hypothetical protein [Alphaproteobacteria bacterium]
MAGILAVWNDCAPEGHAHYERWYMREHLFERVGVPGFRFGRRYEAIAADRGYFTFYEVDDPAVLVSPAYLAQLESPTPWTLAAMAHFRGMIRTVCDLAGKAGRLGGGHALCLRCDHEPPTADAARLHALWEDLPGVVRTQVWRAAAAQTPPTAEGRSRGGRDAMVAGAVVMECARPSDLEAVAARLDAGAAAGHGIPASAVRGTYRLMVMHAHGE